MKQVLLRYAFVGIILAVFYWYMAPRIQQAQNLDQQSSAITAGVVIIAVAGLALVMLFGRRGR